MIVGPPVILVFDISALSATSLMEWREFSRVGNCYLPQVVYEEMKMLFDRSPDPDLERLAKTFNRFYATSGWNVSDANAHHIQLKAGSGQAMTRRARVSLAVGRCAYGLAQEFPHSLVILVSKDRSLLQRLYGIPSVNLCGITGDALLQWSRTGQRPIAVSQKFQQFRSAHGIQPYRSPRPVSSTSEQSSASPSISPQAASPSRTRPTRSNPIWGALVFDWLPEVKSMILAAIGLAAAIYLLWTLLHVVDFRELFQPSSTQQSFLQVDRISDIRYLS
jgi:hypothetical protein